MTATLLLHWHLDEVIDADGVLDSSANHLNGTVEGHPRSLPDERFGSCVALGGSADALLLAATPRLAFPAGYTVEAWIRPTVLGDVGIVGSTGGAFALVLTASGAAGAGGAVSPAGTVKPAIWQHVAAVGDGPTVRLYLDGVLVAQRPAPPAAPAGPDGLVVGRSAAGATGWFDGRIAHVRVYDGALSEAEIRVDMAADEAELAAFVRANPVDFELADTGQQHVLAIDDTATGQPMALTVRNTSRQRLIVNPVAGPVSAYAYHLALEFRPQTLAAVPDPVLDTPGWSMTRDGDVLYFLASAPTALDPGAALVLRLRGMGADGRGGTRAGRVDLHYQHWAFVGQPDELDGTRLQFLDIVNRRGRIDVPLRTSCSGGNRVLSDGYTPNTLRLRIANSSHDVPVTIAGADGADGVDGATAFVIGVDIAHAAESVDWALVTAGTAAAVTLTVTGTCDPVAVPVTAWPQPVRDIAAQSLRWRLVAAHSVTLPPTGWIEVTIDGIVSPVSLGLSEITVGYVNLPGYADTAAAVTVEKSPLLFAGERVGIGTVQPLAKLHVVDQPGDADGGTLILGPVGAANLRLGYAEDYSWIQAHGSRPLALNPIGNNVGIGTTTPGSPLTVQAAAEHLQLRRDVDPGGNILFLELFQKESSTEVHPSIRFHHSQRFWHRIEARADGFHFKTGDTTVDTLVGLHAASVTVTDALSLLGRRFGEPQAQILGSLVNSELEVDLYSFAQGRSLGRVTLLIVPAGS